MVPGKKRVAVWYWPGTNCEVESVEAWNFLGADARLIFAKDFNSVKKNVKDFDIHHFAGGFTYSDDSGVGVIAAKIARDAIQMLVEALVPVILICNGFQIGMRARIFGSGLALVQNDIRRYQSIPVQMRVEKSNCVWTKGLEGEVLSFPAAHGFGKLVQTGDKQPNVVLTYVSESPNGGKVDAICSDNGLIYGGMCHPERPFGNPDGLKIFRNGLAAA